MSYGGACAAPTEGIEATAGAVTVFGRSDGLFVQPGEFFEESFSLDNTECGRMHHGQCKRRQFCCAAEERQLLLGCPPSASSQPQDAALVGRCEANVTIVPQDRNAFCTHALKTFRAEDLFRFFTGL
jgi:hypothetical protein